MSSEREDFAELRRLLALKRHETPPPGYFDRFSREVIVRIKAGEAIPEPGFFPLWLARLGLAGRSWSELEVRPVLAGGFGVAVCAVLGTAFFFTESGADSQSPVIGGLATEPVLMITEQKASAPALFSAPATDIPSTGGMLSPAGQPSLFKSASPIQVQAVSFAPGFQQ